MTHIKVAVAPLSTVRLTGICVGIALLISGLPLIAKAVPTVAIQIDASSAKQHTISPLIYGVGTGSATDIPAKDLQTLNVPINRMGGNTSTTYNWQGNTHSTAADWYYESYPYPSATPGEAADSFVALDKSVGASTMMTIPMIGWVAKANAARKPIPSFSIAKYGAQKDHDPWLADAGNGTKSDGSLVTGNDPNDAYIRDSVANEQAFVSHLTGKWGTAAKGGPSIYLLDNESSIWHGTHRDIHPQGATATEIRDDMVKTAAAIRAADPSARIAGPEEWGWSGYLLSGADQQWGSTHGWGGPFPDKNGVQHGMDYMPWLLGQLKQAGRPIDIFTLHFYPQGADGSADVSSSTQLLRNRSTRQLWDPNYVSESWIADKVDLIHRMKSWVTGNYYADAQIGITEYSWGAENHINGATTQADVLGIFGREGVDVATRWTVPASSTPTFKAMQMFRNYDFNNNGFGDIGVAANVPNPDALSAFAALRSNDGAMTVMIINKSLPASGNVATPVTLNLNGFVTQGTAMTYQLTSANVINRLPDRAVSGSTVSLSVPPQSVTMLVMPGAKGALHEPPFANFQATLGSAPAGGAGTSVPAHFSATGSSATSYPIAAYSWDFGDGSTGTGATVSHNYTAYGFYYPSLTVSDTAHFVGKASKLVIVRPAPVSTQACKVIFTNTGDWGASFTANMHIVNTGSTPLNNWVLEWTFNGNQTITNMWGGNIQASGNYQMTTPAAWDTTIAPGAGIDVGYYASYSGSNAAPTSFRLNGMSCTLQ